jgi:hypothetical protein
VRACLVILLIICGCGKAKEPTRSAEKTVERTKTAPRDSGSPPTTATDYINIKKPPPREGVFALLNADQGGPYASLTDNHFSSSSGMRVGKVETPDPQDATRLKTLLDKEMKSLKSCDLGLQSPSEVEFQLDLSGRASSIALPKGQQLPCLNDWLKDLDFGAPQGGKPVEVKVVFFVARE